MRKELIFNLSFGLVNVLVMIIVIIFARGYYYNPNTNTLEKQGTLVIESDPNGASVYLNDELVGTTPLQKSSIKPGNYSLTVKHNDSFDLDTSVEIIDKYVTKRYYKLIKNKQQLFPITSSNIVSYTFSEDGSYLIYLEKLSEKMSLRYISFDKSAINLALGQDNAYTTGIITNDLLSTSQTFEILSSFDGTEGILKGIEGKELIYFRSENNFTLKNLSKLLTFDPENIFFNKHNNLVIKKNSDYYYFDTNLDTLSLKATISELQKPIINNGIYLFEDNKLKIATTSDVINEYREYTFPLLTEPLVLNYVDEDINGNIFISANNNRNFVINRTGVILPIESSKQFSKAIYRLKNNIYISKDLTELLDINFTIDSINTNINLVQESTLFGKSRDFIITPDLINQKIKIYDINFKLMKEILIELKSGETLQAVYLSESDEVIILTRNFISNITSVSKLLF